jgi:hypothetical protein
MQYDKIKKRTVQFLSITGLKLEDFNFLVPYFKAEWDGIQRPFHFSGKVRQRRTFTRKDISIPENRRN